MSYPKEDDCSHGNLKVSTDENRAATEWPEFNQPTRMKLIDDPKNWVPLKEVAHLLHLSRHTIVRLCDELDPVTRRPYLHAWRPSPGTLLVSRQSLETYCAATQANPEFWSQRQRRILIPRSGPVRPAKKQAQEIKPPCRSKGRP
jgi:hypothetical protein